MAKSLVHIHTGPAVPTMATLGCAVGAAAVKAGHDIIVLLAGDGVHLFVLEKVDGSQASSPAR